MLRGDNDLSFVLKHYDPSREDAITDFLHLYEKLKNGVYGDGDDAKSDFEDWDDDFMFAIKTFFYCIFENPDLEQREQMFKLFVTLVIKRCELVKELG